MFFPNDFLNHCLWCFLIHRPFSNRAKAQFTIQAQLNKQGKKTHCALQFPAIIHSFSVKKVTK